MEKTLRIVRSQQEIEDRISQLAQDIRDAAPNGELTVVGILDDAFVFLAFIAFLLWRPQGLMTRRADMERV